MNDQTNQSNPWGQTQTVTGPNTNGGFVGGLYPPQPCPTCGTCPTCGRKGYHTYPYYPYTYYNNSVSSQ